MMELKVWVDGVVRVVCGLSEETSCQDVVIALAQAIGQTGRYVLIQRLRDTERQLLATERPLESLAKLGQHGNEVQFFLRRTGPSSSDGPNSKQERATPLPLPKHPEPEPSKRSQPKKALTFSLGPSTSPKTKCPYPSPCPSPVSDAHLQEEMGVLEQAMRRNQAELAHEQYWEEELKAEVERERGMRRKLGELHAKLDDCGRRLHEFSVRSAQLEQEIQRETQAQGKAKGPEESLDAVKEELWSQERHGTELEEQLSETDRALEKAESLLQAKQDELEELNKELRQCNLQQFIQQTGVLPDHNLTSVESPPRPTAKQFLGHPRNLQNPLVSSLNPEGVYV
uniref:Ras association domain family member 7a n=1 Tax=Amphilophus citrinellus TaxID=61819 RepID=A0A3Q0QRE3_AMPCI